MVHVERIAAKLGLSGSKSKKTKQAIARLASKVPEDTLDEHLAQNIGVALENESYFVKLMLRNAQRSADDSSSDEEDNDLKNISERRLKSLKMRLEKFYLDRFTHETEPTLLEVTASIYSTKSKHSDRGAEAVLKEHALFRDQKEWLKFYEEAVNLIDEALKVAQAQEKFLRDQHEEKQIEGGLLLSDVVDTSSKPVLAIKDAVKDIVKSVGSEVAENFRSAVSRASHVAINNLHDFLTEKAPEWKDAIKKNADEIIEHLGKLNEKSS
jgi:cobalamin biosynthesis protein CbiD